MKIKISVVVTCFLPGRAKGCTNAEEFNKILLKKYVAAK